MKTKLHILSLLLLLFGCQCSEDAAEERDEATSPRSDVPDVPEDTQSPEVVEDTHTPPEIVDDAVDANTAWWADIVNVCGTNEPKVPAEPYRPGREPLVEGPIPRILWKDGEACPGLGSELLAGGWTAYAEMEVAGELREVVVALFFRQSAWTVISPTIAAVVLSDANTGEPLLCYESPTTYSWGDVPIMVSEWGRFFLATGSGGISAVEGQPTGESDGITLWSDGPGTGGFVRYFTGDQANVSELVLRDGQLLVSREGRVTSFNLLDGEPFWSFGVGEFVDHPEPNGRLSGLFTRPDNTLCGVTWEHEVMAIDDCGHLSETNIMAAQVPLTVDQHVMVVVDGIDATVVRDGVVVHREPRCPQPVLLSQTKAACLKTSPAQGENNQSGEIVVFSFDGSEHMSVPIPIVGTTLSGISYNPRIVAGARGSVLVWASFKGDTEAQNYILRVFAVDTEAAAVRWSLDILPEMNSLSGYSSSMDYPVLTPRGVYTLGPFAIQTDVFGLAPSRHPRGLLGGNENRGFVALPE